MKLELMNLSEAFFITPEPRSKEREEKFPGYYSMWCPFKGGFYHFGLQDSVILVHGPQGCSSNTRTFLTSYTCQYHGTPFIHAPCTDFRGADAILGAEDKLRDGIFEVDRMYRPKLISVIVPCCTGIIKEPVEDIVEEVKDQINAKILAFRIEGFNHYDCGALNVYLSAKFAELFEEPKRKIPKSVNILGVTKEVHAKGNFPEDSQELERLLNKMGLTVNSVLLQAATVEAFERAPEAEFNALICPQWGYPMAKTMMDTYGVPHGSGFNPLGIAAINNWLMDVAEHFGIEDKTQKVIDEEYNQIKDVWEEAKRTVSGKIAFIDGGEGLGNVGRCIAWGRMCADLGMDPIIFNICPIELKGKFHHVAFALERYGFDPKIVYWNYPHHRRLNPLRVIKEIGINMDDIGVYIGDVFPRTVATWEEGIFDPSVAPRLITATHINKNRESPGRRAGFRGAARFARDIIDVNKMARRKKKPILDARVGALLKEA
ncbi:MAG: nitrogenase component 1 [Thermodesulfobacteriota bacterium]|nr:nitrogenase component 1 [Thermodesulfobacteriota bacterium]